MATQIFIDGINKLHDAFLTDFHKMTLKMGQVESWLVSNSNINFTLIDENKLLALYILNSTRMLDRKYMWFIDVEWTWLWSVFEFRALRLFGERCYLISWHHGTCMLIGACECCSLIGNFLLCCDDSGIRFFAFARNTFLLCSGTLIF